MTKVRAYTFFHAGRIGMYAIFGVIAASFTSVINPGYQARALLFFAIGCFMVFIAVALFFRGALLHFLESRTLCRLVGAASANIGKKLKDKRHMWAKLMLLGLLNGVLPCGVVYYFLAHAMLAPTPLLGALVMIIFGAATLPALIFAGVAAGFSARFKKWGLNVATFLVAANGVYLAYMGYVAYGQHAD